VWYPGRQWRGLRVKLIGLVLVSLVLIAGLLGVGWFSSREREQAEALENLTQTAEFVAVIAENTFDEGAAVARAVAADPAIVTFDPVQVAPRLRALKALYPHYTNILLTDRHGIVVGWGLDEPLPSPRQSVATRGFFRRVVATHRPTPIRVTNGRGAEAVGIGVAVPVLDTTGALVGIVAITFDPDHIASRLAPVGMLPSQVVTLIDPEGRTATFSGGGGLTPDALTWEQRDQTGVPGVQAALHGEVATTVAFDSPLLGDRRLAAFVPTPRYRWVVGASWPVAEAVAPAWELRQRELLLFLALALIIVAGALIASHTVIAPLRRLTEHTRRLGDSRFEPIVGVQQNDEIGELAATFNLVGERLQRTLSDLRQEQARLTALVENLPVGIVIRDAPDGTLALVNTRAQQIWRESAERIADPKWLASRRGQHADGSPYHTGDVPLMRSLRAGEVIHGEEMTIQRGDGTIGIATVSSAPIHDEDGRIVAAVAAYEDLTERRETETRLREHEEILRVLVDQFPGGVRVLDRELRYVMSAGERVLDVGLTGEQLIGRRMADLYPAEYVDQMWHYAQRTLAGETVSFDVTPPGRVFRLIMTPLRDATGAIPQFLAVSVDITEERAQLERHGRDDKLRALGQMAGGIAHDLNQVLMLVAGYGEMARTSLDSERPALDELREMLQIIGQAAYDGGATVKRLLTFARGSVDERRQPIDVGTLLHEVEQLTVPRWRDATRANGRSVTLDVIAEPGLTIAGSPSALREALTNLVFNALDAMPHGGTLTLAGRQAGEHMLIDVTDTGVGMTPDVQQRIFEPFFTTKGESGTGLGLAMVFGIIQGHAGHIDVSSRPGHGTTIHLSFPAMSGDVDRAEHGTNHVSAPTLHILVVDDEPKLTMLAAGMLRQDGHTITTAASGAEALACLEREHVDLVLTDLSMGEGMNGWDLAAAIGQAHPGLPVVLATGWGAGIDEAEARRRGVQAVIAKPYRMMDIRAVIERVLNG